MTTAEDIRDIIRRSMPPEMYAKPGSVLYVGTDTLRPGAAYVMGFNPGGDPEKHSRSIIDSIEPRTEYSAYTHECWHDCQEQPCLEHIDPTTGRTREGALRRHQRNMIALARVLGTEPERLFAANAVFARSRRVATLKQDTGYDLTTWWAHCWAAHKTFLAIVRPRVVLTLGYGAHSSAFGLLMRECGCWKPAHVGDHSRRGGRSFQARIQLHRGDALDVRVVGLPHPSYMAVGAPLAEALRAELDTASP